MDDRNPRHACVVGAGIIGSWTALHLAEAGLRTSLLEQFPLPHTRGSSHGASRAFRFLGEATMDRLDDSLERWRGLEELHQERLFLRTGLLNFGTRDDPWLARHLAVLEKAGKPCEWLDAAGIRDRFPLRHYPDDWTAAWDPNGGILLAHRCLETVQARFRALGGTVVQACAEAVEPGPEGFSLHVRPTAGGERQRMTCDRLVVTAGPWTSRLRPELAPLLTTLAVPVTYFRDPTGEYDAARGFPILFNARLTDVYVLPACEYPGLVKVLYHGGPEAEPETRDLPDRSPFVAEVSRYVRQYLPSLDGRQPAVLESCMYTRTPDHEPIVDRLADGTVIGCGFSGSGFKHSPATGRMLAALALGEESALPDGYELGKYALSRFNGMLD